MLILFFLWLLLSPLHQATAHMNSDQPPPSHPTPTVCTSQHMVEAAKASSHCKPMVKVVKLDMPGNGSFTQMTPQFVEALRCGGGCHTPSHSCVSTNRVSRQIPVLLSSCGLTAGLCSKSCATLTIEEDTACRCDCLQEQKICSNARHSFDRLSCSCECDAEEEYTLCRDQGRLWDNTECVCRCPMNMVKPCSTGLTFDLSTCSCITNEASNITNLVTDERVERSDNIAANDKKYSDMMIITVALAGIATVFFIIIISLLNSINTLRRTIISIRQDDKDSAELCSEQSLLSRQNEQEEQTLNN